MRQKEMELLLLLLESHIGWGYVHDNFYNSFGNPPPMG